MSQPSEPATPRVFVLGATHHRAPIAVRERLALGKEGAQAVRERLAQIKGLREFVLLSTCNRLEFYGVEQGGEVLERIKQTLSERQGFGPGELDSFAFSLQDCDAVQHLLEVSSGLDSQMLGETEIFGQVKDAYTEAQGNGSTGAVLNRIFQKAFQAAKHVRSSTAITIGQVSVANVAVDLAQDIFGGMEDIRVLLIGAGEIGEKTAQAFRSRGAGSLTVCSRRFERAVELAEKLGASALPFDHREERLHEFDTIVCATSAPGTVLSAAAVHQAMRRRPARPVLCLDLALPRDIEQSVGEADNVYLYNLDDLAKVAEENRRAREAEVNKARHLLAEKASALWQAVKSRL